MIDGEATAGEQTKLRSNGQWSKGYVAGLERPTVIMQARVNQTFTSLDRVGEVTFDGVTAGSYLDILPGMTVWFGSSALTHDIGMARVRKAGSSTVLFIGETSQLTLADNLYITVLDEYLPWPVHMYVSDHTYSDYDIAYGDQHEVFEPVPVMGADKVAVLQPVFEDIALYSSASATYTGAWSVAPDPYPSKYSNTTGNTCEFTFAGSRIRLYVTKADNQGEANIYIDDVLIETADGYNASIMASALAFDSGVITQGAHTLKVEIAGTKNPSSSGYYFSLVTFDVISDTALYNEITVDFDGSDSWVFDSTITGYTWSAPDAYSSSGNSTATPSFTFRTAGAYPVFCTVTADNGKEKKGVRMVYVVETPVPCSWRSASVSLDGGVSFEVELYTDTTKALIRDRARCILWTEDWYNNTQGSIGFEDGNEHVLMGGWVNGESIELDIEGGSVRFAVKGANWWMDQFAISAPVLDFARNTPSQWTQMTTLTVDKGVWHLLHIRSNITTIMDVRLTEVTDYVKRLESPAGSLWGALRGFADRMFAVPFVDALGRFWLRVEPQMVPEADRSTWPTVMTLTSADLENGYNIGREIVGDISQIDLSGMTCDASGREKSYYALAYGHTPGREGGGLQTDKVVINGQAQLNQLAGLLDGWRNNEYPDIELRLPTNFRVMSLVPHQYIALSIGADENPRGEALAINLIPRGLRFSYDEDAGCIETILEAEAETFETNACNGDIPGVDEDLSEPPTAPPPVDPPLPPGTEGMRPKKVLIKDRTRGLLYTENGDAEDPTDIQWEFVNGGLDENHKGTAMTRIFVTNYGRVYLAYLSPLEADWNEIWASPSIGGVFEKLIDTDWIKTALGVPSGYVVELDAVGINSLGDDMVAFAVLKTQIGWPKDRKSVV